MKDVTIIEIIQEGSGHCGCCRQKTHLVVEDCRESEEVKKVIKKDVIDVITSMACKEDKERLLPKVDKMVEDLVEDFNKIDLNKEIGYVINIINEQEFTYFYPVKNTNITFLRRRNMSVSKELRIFERFSSYEKIPRAVKAWVSIKADKYGLSRNMVHAGIKARYSKIANEKATRRAAKKRK